MQAVTAKQLAEWAKLIGNLHEASWRWKNKEKGYGEYTRDWYEIAEQVVPYPEWREPARVIADGWSYYSADDWMEDQLGKEWWKQNLGPRLSAA